MKHKYLEDIGITSYPWNNWGTKTGLDKIKFKKQQKVYGFDQRDCYDLDITLSMWLYEHLMRFKEDSVKQIDWEGSPKVLYNDKEYTVIALVDKMIDNLKQYITSDDDNFKYENKHLINETFDILKASFGYLWW